MTLDTIREFIEPYLVWIKLGATVALLALVAWGAWHAYTTVDSSAYTRGYNARVAQEASTAHAAQVETERRDRASSVATQSLHQTIAQAVPKIEAATHETAGKVQIIYRDHPLPGVCVRPDGVRSQLDKALAAANAAAAKG